MSDPWLERMKRHLAVTGGEAAKLRDAVPSHDADPDPDAVALPGTDIQTPHGRVRVVRKEYSTAWPYSARPIEQVLVPEVTDGTRWLKDPRLSGFSRDEALFLDVEATGLFQDANNVAFLVGLGWFESNTLILEQLFLESPEEEPALLQHLLMRLDGKRFLVSYNGKAYDKTVLESRFVLNRLMDHQAAHLRLVPHLDLLHLGRRLYTGLISGHRLGTLEKELLQFDRGDDVSGALVPQYYYEWLLRGRVDRMVDVIRHNEVDVLTLVHLADHLLSKVRPGISTGDPGIDANLGWMLLSSGFKQEAVFSLNAALAGVSAADLVKVATRLESALGGSKAPVERVWSVWSAVLQRLPDNELALTKLQRLRQRRK